MDVQLQLCCFLLLLSFVAVVSGFSEYVEPLKMATPRADGVYEFELEILEKLTMSTDGENGHVQVLDYDPDDVETMPWKVRESDQNFPCEAFNIWNSSFNDLSSLLPLHGQHQVVFAVNGKTPADPIVVPFGAEVLLTVKNMLLATAISVHVHGMDKRGLWYTDGVAFLQQCPIPPKTVYQYRFIADTPGTMWWHGHLGMDRGHGLLGAFIVKTEQPESVTVHEGVFVPHREYAMVIQDWTVADSDYIWFAQRWRTMKWQWGFDEEKLGRCWAPTRTYDFGAIGGIVALRTLLINEHGWHNQDDILTRPETLPLAKFKIKRGERVLFRVINGAGSNMMMLTIEGHNFTVVAADGNPVQPVQAGMIIITPAERYDIVVEGLKNPGRKVFPIILETMEHYNKTGSKIEPYYGAGMLVYEDVEGTAMTPLNPDYSHRKRCSSITPCVVLNCPFAQFPTEYNFTCRYVIDFEALHPSTDPILTTSGTDNYEEHFINIHYDSHMNGWMYKSPRGIPYFHKQNLDTIADTCNRTACPPESDKRFDDNCFCFYHISLKLGNYVQFIIYNMGYGGGYTNGYAHPFHLHGTHFYLLKVGFPTYNATNFVAEPNSDIDCEQTKHCNEKSWRNSTWLNGNVPGMNTRNPTYRDTVPVPMGGYIVIRFRADNPGWWLAHCHLMLHQVAGMAFALKIGEHEQMPIPPRGFPNSCGNYDAAPLDPEVRRNVEARRTRGY